MLEFKQTKSNPLYSVSKCGKVINNKIGKIRKTSITNSGYEMVGTRHGQFYVHRLVAEVWVENPDNKPQVNHIDGNKLNNHADNLEWVTRRENMLHARDNGLLKPNPPVGEMSNLSRHSEADIRFFCDLIASGMRLVDITAKYDVSRSTLKGLKSGRDWKHITKDYKFPKRENMYSEKVVRWVCEQISQGVGNTEILNSDPFRTLTLHAIKNIKYKSSYSYISDEYF